MMMMFRFEERYCICVDDGKDNIGQQTTYYSNHDEANKTTHLLIMWSRMTLVDGYESDKRVINEMSS